jgi:hypothetical protein
VSEPAQQDVVDFESCNEKFKNENFTLSTNGLENTATKIKDEANSYKDGVLLAVPNGSKLLENVVVVEKKSENGTKNGNQNGQNTAEVIAKMKDQEAAINITSTIKSEPPLSKLERKKNTRGQR